MTEKNSSEISFEGKTFFVGIDVDSKHWVSTIRMEGLELKRFSHDPSPEVLAKYLKKTYPGGTYKTVYEAGYSGFWAQRELERLGCKAMVTNPADVPTSDKEKDRKTNSVDSRKLSRELEKGSLKPIYIPDVVSQNFRTLVRHLHTCVKDESRVKIRIKSFLYYNGIDFTEYDSFTKKFIAWLETLDLDKGPERATLRSQLRLLRDIRVQIQDIVAYLKVHIEKDKDAGAILGYLQSIPGIGFRTAVILYAELMDMGRFKTFDQLKSYVGLVPSTDSTGDREKICGVTNRKNNYLRYILIEVAWVAVRHDSALLEYYSGLLCRMSKQRAILRVAKKVLSRIRYVWMNRTEYKSSLK